VQTKDLTGKQQKFNVQGTKKQPAGRKTAARSGDMNNQVAWNREPVKARFIKRLGPAPDIRFSSEGDMTNLAGAGVRRNLPNYSPRFSAHIHSGTGRRAKSGIYANGIQVNGSPSEGSANAAVPQPGFAGGTCENAVIGAGNRRRLAMKKPRSLPGCWRSRPQRRRAGTNDVRGPPHGRDHGDSSAEKDLVDDQDAGSAVGYGGN